jgi:ADP-ribosylglycohydrolase
MADTSGTPEAEIPPRPLPATYWLVPGRLLVGEHPGSQSRADAMDRLRRFLVAGVTCFVDLTEPGELPSYEGLLPFATPDGRRVEYLREPLRDHGVPSGPETVQRVIAMIDDALAAGHVVYLHCRAGIGRSATIAGCWLAARDGDTSADPLARLQSLWQQSARSQGWPVVPETEEQAQFVRGWMQHAAVPAAGRTPVVGVPLSVADRLRGMLLGLALGDAMGEARRRGDPGNGDWTQHTAMALCLAESLLARGGNDARDQMERYLLWQRDGHLSARGLPGQASPDVARAIATWQWRGLPQAGSHDPRDRSTTALPRVVSAVAYALADPAAAVTLAADCARTTHQSPLILDACRYYAALLVGALRGVAPRPLCSGVFEPVAGLWTARPLKPELVTGLTRPSMAHEQRARAAGMDVVHALVNFRAAVLAAEGVTGTIDAAVVGGCEPALDGALAGALAGALHGAAALLSEAGAGVVRLDLLDDVAARLVKHCVPTAAADGEPRT